MNLNQYLESNTASGLASAIGVTPAFISQLANGHRPVPAERCPAIERATHGVVRCEDLRPDVDWSVLRGTDTPHELAKSAA